MGNSESSNPIRNMDKRTARREYRADFIRAISDYRARHPPVKSGIRRASGDWFDGNIKVFVRKRPIFKHELDAYEFDVATCTAEDRIVIHDARMHNDMKRQIMNHHEFQFDRTFNENAKNDEVYNESAKALVNISCEGGYSTCLVYGQTGSGKTFTMSSIYEHAAYDIFHQLDKISERFSVAPTVSMSFVEIAGDLCHDLLNKFTPAQLLTGSDGSVHAFPVIEPTVACAEELIAMIQHGMGVRTTAATGVHDQSSRSHAILRIYIQRHDLKSHEVSSVPGGKPPVVEGTLTLVDLAGSEHRIDSMYHGKERRKETGNINASLMALKDCIRARAMGQVQSFQYRRSKLTQALKATFSLPSARTIIIATVSPASKDTEHSLNTLRHACIMHGQQDLKAADRETRFVTGGTVTSELIGEVNLTEIGRRNAGIKRAGGTMDGPKTHNGNAITDSKAAKAANNEVEVTEKERLRLRKAAELKSISKMLPQYREILKHFRGQLGQNRQQTARLQRLPADPNAIIEEETEVPYESPARSTSDHNGSGDNEGYGDTEDEVGDDVHDFHSSLTKKDRNRLDLHDLAMANGSRHATGSDSESVEDEVESYVERHAYKSERPNSASSKHTSGKVAATRPKAQPQQTYYDDYTQDEEDEVVEEEVRGRYENAPGSVRQSTNLSKATATSNRASAYVSTTQSERPRSSSQRHLHSSHSQAQEDSYLSPPKPPVNSAQQSGAVTGVSPSKKRLDFQRLHATIYEGAEGVPDHILKRQLTSLLVLHGYTDGEIELMFEMNALLEENAAIKKAVGRQGSQQSISLAPAPAPVPALVQRRSVSTKRQLQPVYQEEPAPAPVPQRRPVSIARSPPGGRDNFSLVGDDTPLPNGIGGSSMARAGARVVNSPVSTNAAPAARARSSPRPSAQISTEQRNARLAEEKERREREGLAEAAAQLESQAAQRKARQDAARALREQQEEERRQKAARLAAQGAAQKQALLAEQQQQQQTNSIRAAVRRNEEDPITTHSTAAASRASIRKHEEEISYLTEQLRAESITEATQFAIKRSIAVRKAALLRERRAAAEKSYLIDEYEEPVPIKASTRQGAAFDVGLDLPTAGNNNQAGSAERGSSRGAASRPKAQGFNAADFEPLPVAKVQSGKDRYGGQGVSSGPAGRARRGVVQVEPEEAFGGPRWDNNDSSEPVNTAFSGAAGRGFEEDHYALAGRNSTGRSQSTSQLEYSPRGGQQANLEGQMGQMRLTPSKVSPRADQYAPRGRGHGAAAAPFGNDYSYEESP